jgi:HPt (histidine-containing phosphotransfer) domain-containing protein
MAADPLDPALVARLRRIGGDALLGALIDSFAGEAPARIEALRAATAKGDLEWLAGTAHQIVAGAGQLGATTLSTSARTLEETARSGDRGGAADLVPALITEFDAALAALAKIRTSAP